MGLRMAIEPIHERPTPPGEPFFFWSIRFRSLGGGCDFAFAVIGRRAPRTTAGLRRWLLLRFRFALLARSDRGREHVERDPLLVLRRFRTARSVARRTVTTVAAILPLFTLRAAILLDLLGCLGGVFVLSVITITRRSGVLALLLVVAEILSLAALLFEAGAVSPRTR